MKRLLFLLFVALVPNVVATTAATASECNYEPQTPLPGKLFHGKGGYGTICDYIETGPDPIFPNAYAEFYGIWEGEATDSTNHSTGLVSVVVYEDYAGSKGVQIIYSWEESGPLPAGYHIITRDTLIRGDGFLQGAWVGSRTGIHYTLMLRIDAAGKMALRLDRRKGSASNHSTGTLYRVTPDMVNEQSTP